MSQNNFKNLFGLSKHAHQNFELAIYIKSVKCRHQFIIKL